MAPSATWAGNHAAGAQGGDLCVRAAGGWWLGDVTLSGSPLPPDFIAVGQTNGYSTGVPLRGLQLLPLPAACLRPRAHHPQPVHAWVSRGRGMAFSQGSCCAQDSWRRVLHPPSVPQLASEGPAGLSVAPCLRCGWG